MALPPRRRERSALTLTVLSHVLLCLLAQTPHAAELQIIQAGARTPWQFGPALPSSSSPTTLCPAALFPQFSVQCTPADASTAQWADFFINGVKLRRENVVPFTLAGDFADRANAWTDLPDFADIRCELSNGDSADATVAFSCDDDALPASPAASPDASPDAPTPDPTPAPVDPDDGGPAAPPSDTPEPTPSGPPSTDAPTTTAVKQRTTTTTTATADTTTTMKATMPTAGGGGGGGGGSGKGGCVDIPATSFVSNKGWVKLDGGMAFKPNDDSKGISKPGEEPLEFKFEAPETSRFGFSIDMRTSNGVDYNDVWAIMEDVAWSLERPGSTEKSDGWTKAYHNKNQRAVAAFSVDFNPHVFSTDVELQKGKTYTLKLGGRSSKVTVYRSILFPCSGESCRGSGFNSLLDKCV